MKKTIFLSFLLLFIASPIINAVTFKKYSGERLFYLPNMSNEMEANVYELHQYDIEFPIDGSNALKKAILDYTFDYKGSSISSATEEFLSNYIGFDNSEQPQLASKTTGEDSWVQESKVWGKLMFQSTNLIAYEAGGFTYFAGATHGLEGVAYLNFYTPTQKVLSLYDVLLKSKESTILSRLRKQARIVARNKQCFNAPNEILISENFYITKKGITFVYQPYEIACYADGIIKITIPKSQLTGCLTTLGKKLIK